MIYFVLFLQASQTSVNFNISELVYSAVSLIRGTKESEPVILFQNVCMLFLADSHHSPGGTASLYGGDIKFTPKQQENMKKYGTPNSPQSRAASNVDSERWPNAVIPYVFDCSVGKLITWHSLSFRLASCLHFT